MINATAVPTPSKPECDYETGSGRWMEYALFLEGSLREAERKLANEYICTCGLRVTPHRCDKSEGF
jgi:hypothetical protein